MADCILDRVNTFRAGPVRDDVTLIIADFDPVSGDIQSASRSTKNDNGDGSER